MKTAIIILSDPKSGSEEALGRVFNALALASGVTVENVEEYLPYVDAYLVGTGIEERLGVLDPDAVSRLHQRISARVD